MNKLKEFIKKLVKEYTGIGASGGNSTDGNDITSPRPFPDDTSEIENYILKNVYGGEGGQRVGDMYTGNYPNRHPQGMFELKNAIKKILDEIKADDYGDATLTTQGQYKSRFTKTGKPPGIMENKKIQEQVTQAAQRAYEAGLKRLQKGVLRFQLRFIEKQRAASISQAAKAGTEASKGFDEQIKALQDQIAAIDNPPQQNQQNESLLKKYINERKNSDLMRYMDSYKRGILLESTVKKLFKKFDKGESNENITKNYAKKGIQIPETFLSKIRKQYESLKKLKLEIGFSEQEAKDAITIPLKAPNVQLFDLEPKDEKELSSRLYKENKIVKKYEIPPEIKEVLEDKLKLKPLIRFVEGLKAVNSIPPSYRIFLLNGQDFFIIYEEAGLMAKIGINEYYLDHFQERNYAVKEINKLLTQPKMRAGDQEDTSDLEPPDPTAGGPTPPPSPPADEPEDEE